MPLIKVAYFVLNFLNLKSFLRHLFFWVASSLSMVCLFICFLLFFASIFAALNDFAFSKISSFFTFTK